jgi:hypothetical protein
VGRIEVVTSGGWAAGARTWVARHPVSLTVGFGIVCAVIAWLRLPAIARDTLWAEDGRTFLQGALSSNSPAMLFAPYAGYLHLLPRIIAALTVQFVPVSLYAQAMTAGSCIAAGVMAAIVYVCSADVVRWMPARIVIALLTVLAPLAPREVLGNAANLHSLVMWTVFWMLLYRPRTRLGSYLLGCAALIGALTEIQLIFLLPLALLRVRDRASLWTRVGWLVGVLAQLSVTVLWPRSPGVGPAISMPSLAYGFVINSVLPVWIPQNSIGRAIVWGGPLLVVALCVPFAVALYLGLRYGTRAQRVAALALVGAAALVYAGSVLENPHPYYNYASLGASALRTPWLTRYGVVPSMMLCALIPLAVDVLLARRRQAQRFEPRMPAGSAGRTLGGPAARVVAASVVVALVGCLLAQFVPQETRRSGGPAWQPQIAALRETCERLPDNALIRVNETLGWQVAIPCARIE